MSTNYFLDKNADWRKKAAMTAVNDLDVEKAFADQASGFVENKLEPLMRAPYNIGFEVVRKNDDNTRLIGIFAFKVDDHLLFAPVFFLSGEIKGPLLYRCDTKTFVPANKDWATYLISSMEGEEGKGIPRSRRSDSAPLVQMQRINFMPAGAEKRASVAAARNTPTCTCSPIPTPDGNCTVVISVSPDYSSSATWNNRLPGGESLLKLAAADDGTIRCEFEEEKFMLSAKDGQQLAGAHGASEIHTPDGVLLKLASTATERVRTAFFDSVPDYTDQWADTMLRQVVEGSQVGVLKDFLKEADYGRPAAEAIVKAANAYEFAEALADCYPTPDELFPKAYSTTKKASAPGGLTIQYSVDVLPAGDNIKKEYFRDGFYILDSRPKETMSVVTEESPCGITSVVEAGVYNILKEDGTFENDVLVSPYADPCVPDSPAAEDACVLIKDGKISVNAMPTLLGVRVGSVKSFAGLRDTVEKKKSYMLVLPSLTYGVVNVIDAYVTDGVQYLLVCYDYVNMHGCTDHVYVHGAGHGRRKMAVNPAVATTNLARGIIGRDAKFVEIPTTPKADYGQDFTPTIDKVYKDGGRLSYEKLEHIGSNDNMDAFIYSTWKLPRIHVRKEVTQVSTKSAGTRYLFSTGKETSVPMNRCESLVKLARDMGIEATKAYEILNKADENGVHSFYLEPGEKVAMRLRVVDRPNFDESFDSEFGVPLQPTKEYNLRIQGEQMFEPPSAIGDMLNPTTVSGLPDATVVTTKPEDLRALADTYQLPHVFEHSVVGTLADTFDAMALLDKYVPRIEDAVDALFRTLFLLYWRPSDFEKVYGVDDMPNVEAETVSNGEALGAMLLRLLKKTDAYKKGMTNRLKSDQGQR